MIEEPIKILFVCSRNEWRSRTAEAVFKNHAFWQVRSAGTSSSARIKVSANLLIWADVIFVMEHHHKKRLYEKFPMLAREQEMVVLDIPDEYTFMDEALVEILEKQVPTYLNDASA